MSSVPSSRDGGLPEFFAGDLPALIAAMPRSKEDSGFALPDATLQVLREIVVRRGITRVFEFGSGRSTAMFLEAGCQVTCLEDSGRWLAETVEALSADRRARLQPVQQALATVWDRGSPFKGWRLDDPLRHALREAQLVLIDSPSFPPFREHALLLGLRYAEGAILVVDDANIPTVQRFCRRLSRQSPGLSALFTERDHGLAFFGQTGAPGGQDRGRDFVETVKAWRRFWLGRVSA